MTQEQRPWMKLALALLAFILLPSASRAQSVALGSGLTILDGGSPVVTIDRAATHQAGGNGRNASLFLKDAAGAPVLSFVPSDLTLGGGSAVPSDDGDLRLLDTDGTTVSIDLDGRLGLLTLGAVGEDGDIYVNDSTGTRTFQVDGNTGNVTNALGGNGLVKGWAHIDGFNGNVISCWRCQNASTMVEGGIYRVRFPGLGDIQGRPRLVTVYDNDPNSPPITFGISDIPVFRTRDSTVYADAVVIEAYEPNSSSPDSRPRWHFVLVVL